MTFLANVELTIMVMGATAISKSAKTLFPRHLSLSLEADISLSSSDNESDLDTSDTFFTCSEHSSKYR
jgi:hypothetical protein